MEWWGGDVWIFRVGGLDVVTDFRWPGGWGWICGLGVGSLAPLVIHVVDC